MKVKNLNNSSIKTRELIKKTFIELIYEKKEISKVTVSELVKRANIHRSTFYSHFDNIYDIAECIENETINTLINTTNNLKSKKDILDYFDKIIIYLKENEEIYKMLLSANEPLMFLGKLNFLITQKVYTILPKNLSAKENKKLKLDVSFFSLGIINLFAKYFRNEIKYSLDDIHSQMKVWFEKIF